MLGVENPVHLLIVLVVLLLLFGAKRLPEMGRSLGGGLRGFKESISGESPATDHVDRLATAPAPAAQPAPAVMQPVASAAQPAPAVMQPVATAVQPAPAAMQPVATAAQPAAATTLEPSPTDVRAAG